jgi:hypothetical protein
MSEYRILAIDDDHGLLKSYQQILMPEQNSELDDLGGMWNTNENTVEPNLISGSIRQSESRYFRC